MPHTTTTINDNVILVEPNILNGNENQTNTIPQYQDMYIFAELTATRKGRSVIVNNRINEEFSADFGKINFIGNNQDDSSNNPNYLNFTTNYYEDSVGNRTQYEGFGISNIKMEINSSYIPRIKIQFVDIRGLAFFNRDDSPYRMLFDFPPPIFTLTVKGYYGKPLTYKMHLVKYNSEFSSDNGNFVIDAEFVALTFAPLTDILFKYVLNTPLIELGGNMSSDPGEPPSCTFDMILKLKSVYAEVGELLKTADESTDLRAIETQLDTLNIIDDVINNIYESEILTNVGNPYLARRSSKKPTNFVEIYKAEEGDYLQQIRNIKDFNNVIIDQQKSKNKDFKQERIFILYQVASNLGEDVQVENPSFIEQPIPDIWSTEGQNRAAYWVAMNKFKERLLGENLGFADIQENDIVLNRVPEVIADTNLKDQVNSRTKYYGMELTEFYYKLYYKKGELLKRKEELSEILTGKINAVVRGTLGMLPTVYNVFKIILNDVDTFFKIMKDTAIAADKSHNEPANLKIITGKREQYGEPSNIKKVYPFPLIINKIVGKSETRVAPIDLSEEVPFPELNLVSDFIDTILRQKKWEEQYNLRGNQNDDGQTYWIPIVPVDSVLGGASPTSPYLGLSDNIRDDVLRILLTRYYIFTQGALPYDIYPNYDTQKGQKERLSKTYIDLYSVAEAINLDEALASQSKKAADVIEEMCKRYTNNIQNFYDDIANLTATYQTASGNVTGNLFSFPENDPISFPITPSDNNSLRVYTDKNRLQFVGLTITNEPVGINDENDTTDRFNEFIKNKGIGGKRTALKRGTYSFTTDNLLYLKDQYNDKDFTGNRKETKGTNRIDLEEGISTGLYTRFLNKYTYFDDSAFTSFSSGQRGFTDYSEIRGQLVRRYPDGNQNTVLLPSDGGVITAYNEGHASFGTQLRDGGGKLQFNMGNNITDVWASSLGHYDNDDKIYPLIKEGTGVQGERLGSVLFLSNFGNVLSPFAQFPNDLRTNYFMIPSVIEAPTFVGAYMGALLTAIEEGWDDEIRDFFTTTVSNLNIVLPNKGYYVMADLHDVDNYLAESDKQTFMAEYTEFMRNYDIFLDNFDNLYQGVKEANEKIKGINNITKSDIYKYFLDPNVDTRKRINDATSYRKGQFGESLLGGLIIRTNIIINSEKTFNRIPLVDYSAGYKSLSDIINDAEFGAKYYKPTTDNYFETLFTQLKTLIGDTKKDLKDEYIEQLKLKGDRDIINQLYYSFKNINDKWLTGGGQSDANYPLITGNRDTSLIEKFKFVDRAMNPIGETMLNVEMLIDLVDNDEASVFTVLSSLLSANGFIFFPLQNFLSFDNPNSWEDSFKIHTGSIQNNAETYFVAMYIGGSSSYPSTSEEFENDGIQTLEAPLPEDFNTRQDSQDYEENREQETDRNFPFRQVRAFRVRFGEQNQSMFKDIKIDSKEYNDTNESIQILSRLAGDNKELQPTPKGQNLYNVFENRSYKASVTGLGNAMIQPTQYFQLENIPMFNGAYIILDVQHEITPNHMTTTFSGTKILKYPVPRVTEAMALRGYDNVSAGEATRIAGEAQNAATTQGAQFVPQAKNMSKERLDLLDSVYGVDLSHWNGNINWKQLKTNGVDVSFAIMKITQGDHLYSGKYSNYNFNKNISEAKANGVEVGFYHFAEFGRTSDPEADGLADANYCISKLQNFDKPKLPIVLDLEMDCFTQPKNAPYLWSNRDGDVKIYVQKWIETMEAAGYDVMIYTAPQYIKNVSTDYLSNYPLWYARVYNVNTTNPETNEPSTPISGWNDWDIWQFSFQGSVAGINGNVDINAMRKSFLNKYV